MENRGKIEPRYEASSECEKLGLRMIKLPARKLWKAETHLAEIRGANVGIADVCTAKVKLLALQEGTRNGVTLRHDVSATFHTDHRPILLKRSTLGQTSVRTVPVGHHSSMLTG